MSTPTLEHRLRGLVCGAAVFFCCLGWTEWQMAHLLIKFLITLSMNGTSVSSLLHVLFFYL